MELRTWIVSEHEAVLSRFEQSVASVVPLERWLDSGGDGGAAIAWLGVPTPHPEDGGGTRGAAGRGYTPPTTKTSRAPPCWAADARCSTSGGPGSASTASVPTSGWVRPSK